MSRGIQYTPDRNGMRELMVSSAIRDIVTSAAEAGASWLRSAAPPTPADYGSSVHVDSFNYHVFGEIRACASIYNSHPAAVSVDREYALFPRVVDVIEAGSR